MDLVDTLFRWIGPNLPVSHDGKVSPTMHGFLHKFLSTGLHLQGPAESRPTLRPAYMRNVRFTSQCSSRLAEFPAQTPDALGPVYC